MNDYRRIFFELACAQGALRFGDFTLKSGRKSPYFFNAGAFHSGSALRALGQCYSAALTASGVAFDMLFGPAYKGIPLVSATAIALAEEQGLDVPWAFDRKEQKDHGEGGNLIGACLAGRVLVVDDVITAGTSLAGAIEMIEAAGARLAGALIALDRQEPLPSGRTVVESLQVELGLPIISIATLDDLMAWLETQAERRDALAALHTYRERFGVTMTN